MSASRCIFWFAKRIKHNEKYDAYSQNKQFSNSRPPHKHFLISIIDKGMKKSLKKAEYKVSGLVIEN